MSAKDLYSRFRVLPRRPIVRCWRRLKRKKHETHLLGELASLVRGVQDLIEEDREVERKSQADWVGRLHLILGDVERLLVALLRLLDNRCKVGISIFSFPRKGAHPSVARRLPRERREPATDGTEPILKLRIDVRNGTALCLSFSAFLSMISFHTSHKDA